MKKKLVTAFVVSLLIPMLIPVTASAHGHNKNYRSDYVPCSVEGCEIDEVHKHDDVYYCGHLSDSSHTHGSEHRSGRHH